MNGPTAHWVGPKTLVGLWAEGREINALVDSGSQLNTVTPGYVHQYEFPVLPLCDLVDHPLNLIGLGGMRTCPLGFVILQVQVNEITGYNKDVVFLVVPNESEYSQCVALMIETCILGKIVNVIKESELDRLSTSWAMARVSHLLSRWGTVVEDPGMAGDGPAEKEATTPESPVGQEVDEPVFMKENVRLGPFQTQILECKVKPPIGESAHVMVTPLRAGESHPSGVWPLPPGLHVLHAYTRLKMSSNKVSLVVRNMSESPIFLKKRVHVARVVSASLVPPAELSLDMEAILGAEAEWEPMSVTERQENLLEKLNLDGLSNWTPQNAAVAQDLVLVFNDIFTLEGNELGCTSAVKHEIHITDSEPFKEWFRCIPPPLLEEVYASLHDMLDTGAIHPSQSLWCNTVVLVRKKDGSLCFCMDFCRLNAHTKKDSYPLLWIQEALESMVGTAHFSTMDLKSGFWQVKMVPGSQQYTTFTMGNLGFYEFTCMLFGLCNTPVTFQCLMQNILGELNLTYCIIYLDDLILFGHSEEEHLECLHVVFECIREFNLKLKPSKCLFFQSEIVYLVHHISCEEICPSRENVHAIEEFPMPETFTQVCAFCRLVGHYQCFIKGFTHIARPLYDVLRKEVKMGLVWLPPEVQEVMRILKDKIQSALVLVFPDFDKQFLLETDASKGRLGAVLSQKQDERHYHPVVFGSHSLMPVEKNYHSLKLEFLNLKWGMMKHFREHLAYVPFVVRMDYNPYHSQLGCQWVQMGWCAGLI